MQFGIVIEFCDMASPCSGTFSSKFPLDQHLSMIRSLKTNICTVCVNDGHGPQRMILSVSSSDTIRPTGPLVLSKYQNVMGRLP